MPIILTQQETESMWLEFFNMSASDQISIYGMIHDRAAANKQVVKSEVNAPTSSSFFSTQSSIKDEFSTDNS